MHSSSRSPSLVVHRGPRGNYQVLREGEPPAEYAASPRERCEQHAAELHQAATGAAATALATALQAAARAILERLARVLRALTPAGARAGIVRPRP